MTALLLPALSAVDVAVGGGSSAARATVPFSAAPAQAALDRLLPHGASQFTLVPVARSGAGPDSFTVSGAAGAIQVQGTSPATLLAGVGWYLRTVAHVDIGLQGDSTSRLPATLPAVPSPFTDNAVVPNRYALNDTDNGYSGAYRGFADYQHEIDVLALHGYNEMLVTVGAEEPYYQVMQQYGYSASALQSAWVPAPGHQPWWLLDNLQGLGPASDQLIAARAAVGRQVCQELLALGMTPVLPGYYGVVPTDFASLHPGAEVVPQGQWAGDFQRGGWLAPTDPLFPQIAKDYYAYQASDFGLPAGGGMEKMDPWHEGGTSGGVSQSAAGTAIQNALSAAHPGAIWVILGWEGNPTSALLSGVDKSKMLVVDGESDWTATVDRESDWSGTPYAFGTIDNFGNRTTLGAHAGVWSPSFHQALTKSGSTLKGIAYMPEGTSSNPAMFELFGDLAWSAAPLDLNAWFADYAGYRYGGTDPNAAAAWDRLRTGPYSLPANGSGLPPDDLLTQEPFLGVPSIGAGFGAVQTALNDLLKVPPALQTTDAFRFDVVDVARQAMDDRASVLLGQITGAYQAKDLATFRSLVNEWDADVAKLDALLGTDARFMVGPWIAQATSFAASYNATAKEQSELLYDARSLITTWVDDEAAGLDDYACREWSGLVTDLYGKRWDGFFAALDAALVADGSPAQLDFFQRYDDPWAHAGTAYPTTPTGDPVAAAAVVAGSLPTVAVRK